MLLSICIPTLDRQEHLDNCLNSILISSKNTSHLKFEVCISDNGSDYDVQKLISKYDKNLNIKFKKNSKNLGFSLNAIQSVSMASGEFVWLIGNDDLLLPCTLSILKNLLVTNTDVEFFFINSYFLNSQELKKHSSPINTEKIELKNLRSISSLKKDKSGNFWDVIDPKVSWDFLIGIFLSVFKRDKWIQNLDVLNQKEIEDVSTWSNFDNTCTHPKVLSSAFKNSKAYICSKPLSINLVGEREWFSLYNFIEIVRIPELLDYYRSLGMPLLKFLYCKNFALRNFSNYFFKIIIGGNKTGLNYVNFKRHFLCNLYFPNVYLSVFYFLIRYVKKIIFLKK